MADYGLPIVVQFGELLQQMLRNADEAKPTDSIEPPIGKPDLGDTFERINDVFPPSETLAQANEEETAEEKEQRTAAEKKRDSKKRNQYAIIETAARETFNKLLATTTIDSPAFVQMWYLLDIISIFSDDEVCDPALAFWLVEELLDSQTIAGCRKTFEYLESRRDRLTAKHFEQKKLVILRFCNELLRRLSRAEDTKFCGRVFIFMFQSFPLGDRSAVNLRGEFHTENITTYDEVPLDGMDVDSESKTSNTMAAPNNETINNRKTLDGSKPTEPLSIDKLYPVFWSLQQSLSRPKSLFEKNNFIQFKSAVDATKIMFTSVHEQNFGRPTRPSEETKRSPKRKTGDEDDDLANAFNPKYLTSRDLFELEISDLSFRRHILVQILIIVDFFLSLSPTSKAKLSETTLPTGLNKSVLFAEYSLSEEDETWAKDTKAAVLDLIKKGLDGPHFHRMIESVLSRDKNWVRWKLEGCLPIAKDSVKPSEYIEVKANAHKAATSKRLRPTPLASLDLKFLSENNAQAGLERLKDVSRYEVPSVKSFKAKMQLDDMDIEMAMSDEKVNAAMESKASKSWRALRLASTTNLVAFDKIERSDKIDVVFLDPVKVEEAASISQETNNDGDSAPLEEDRRSIIIAGPSGVGKGTLVKMLLTKYPKVLEKKVSYTTRTPREGEVDGKDYNFITKEKHSMMRDADEFVEYNNFNGNDYGTTFKQVDAIIERGRIPIMEMEYHGIKQTRDNGFKARTVFIEPPSMSELEARIRKRNDLSDTQIQGRLKIAKDEIDHSKEDNDNFYDQIFINDSLEETFEKLDAYLFGTNEASKDDSNLASKNVEMSEDAPPEGSVPTTALESTPS